VNEVPRDEQGKAVLTELFETLKTAQTPIIVDNIVNRIDEVARGVRFEGWQSTIRGDQEVRQALRKRSTSSSRSAITTSSRRRWATCESTTNDCVA